MPSDLAEWLEASNRLRFNPGERLIRPDEINSSVFLILTGTVRLIAKGDEHEGSFTLDKRGAGQLIGWASLLRGAPTEHVLASTEVVVLSLPGNTFIRFIQEAPEFAACFFNMSNQHESYAVAVAAGELQAKRSAGWRNDLLKRVQKSRTISLGSDLSLEDLKVLSDGWNWHLSTPDVPGVPVGTALLTSPEKLPKRPGFLLPYRLVALPKGVLPTPTMEKDDLITAASDIDERPTDLQQLGILEEDHLDDESRHPIVRGRGPQREALAVCEMVALSQQVPFRRDAIIKVLENQFRRDKGINLELIAGLWSCSE